MENKNTAEIINLKDYRNFVNIEGNYGAYQNWLYTGKLKKKFWADRACGVAAAGNVAYYLTENHNKKLYPYNDITIKNFTLFLNDISKHIKPRFYGIPTLYHMRRGFIKFAMSKGINLRSETISMRSKDDSIVVFIKRALRDDYPLMMLTWNTKQAHLKYHWVTITGYFRDNKGNNFVTTSNWGRREVFNLDRWLAEKSFYKGLIYFK